MAKRAIIVHGWAGNPQEGWFPWLKAKLIERGFAVQVPQMPDAEIPKIEPWVAHLKDTVGLPTVDTILIGHSIGCQTIIRYLETLAADEQVGPCFLVAPFLELLEIGEDEEHAIAEPWLTTPLDYKKIQAKTQKIVALFSDNDPFVPLGNVELFEQRLGAQTHIFPKKGHFSGENGIFEIPELLTLIES
jgi:predicted alpha/beta hydrolase family esterase